MKYLLPAFILLSLLLGSCSLFETEDNSEHYLKGKVTDRLGNTITDAEVFIVFDEAAPSAKYDPSIMLYIYTMITPEQHVSVFWGCQTDPGITGYRIYRSNYDSSDYMENIGPDILIGHTPGCTTYEYIDEDVIPGDSYFYYVRVYGSGGADWGLNGPVMTVVAEQPPSGIPAAWNLSVPDATFYNFKQMDYAVPVAGRIKLEVRNSFTGASVILLDDQMQGRYHQISWWGKDSTNTDLCNGVYQVDLYSFDESNLPVLQKSILLLKNNNILTNQPVQYTTASGFSLPFDGYFRFKDDLSVWDTDTSQSITSHPPRGFTIHVHKAGFQSQSRHITINDLHKDYRADFILEQELVNP